MKLIIICMCLLILTSCVTVEVNIYQNSDGNIKTHIYVSDPDTIRANTTVAGQRNF